MGDNRWYDDDYRRDDRRSWTERAGDEVRSWFGDDEARMRRGNDERHERFPYGGERSWRDQGDSSYERTSSASNWRGARDYGRGSDYGRSSDFNRGSDWGRGTQEYSRGDWRRVYSRSCAVNRCLARETSRSRWSATELLS